MSGPVAFHKPVITGNELRYIAQAVARREIRGDGPFTQACARLLEERFGIGKVLMTASCTAALELAAMLCGLEPGDEVILPSFTFSSTANAFLRSGARPVFVDIRPDTLNLDESLVEGAVTPRTRAIVPVHYAGIGCHMGPILGVARRYGLTVVEDAAQGVNAFYRGRALGSLGHLGAYSFHETKNYACGEGGALCVNDPGLLERAEVLRDKGTDRGRFLRGEVDKYTWVDVGCSGTPSEIACAFLYAQLEAMDEIRDRRRRVRLEYQRRLGPLERAGRLRLPRVPDDCQGNDHIFYILLNDEATRDALMAYLKAEGISAVFHYVPLHTAPVGRRLGYRPGDLPVTEGLSARLLRLPCYPDLTAEEQDRVIGSVTEFLDVPRSAPRGHRRARGRAIRRAVRSPSGGPVS
jgi:dTDP-4-amino-4,6-dideoxygalactose transaminase